MSFISFCFSIISFKCRYFPFPPDICLDLVKSHSGDSLQLYHFSFAVSVLDLNFSGVVLLLFFNFQDFLRPTFGVASSQEVERSPRFFRVSLSNTLNPRLLSAVKLAPCMGGYTVENPPLMPRLIRNVGDWRLSSRCPHPSRNILKK